MNKNKLIYIFMISSLLSLSAIEVTNGHSLAKAKLASYREESTGPRRTLSSLVNNKILKYVKNEKQVLKVIAKADLRAKDQLVNQAVRLNRPVAIVKASNKPKISMAKTRAKLIQRLPKVILNKENFNTSKKMYIKQTIKHVLSSVKKDTKESKLIKYELNSSKLVHHYGFKINHNIKKILFSELVLPFPIKIETKIELAKKTSTKKNIASVKPAEIKKKTNSIIKMTTQETEQLLEEDRIIASFQKNLKLNKSNIKKKSVDDEMNMISFDYSDGNDEKLISDNVMNSVKRIMANQNTKKITAVTGNFGKPLKGMKLEDIKLHDDVKLKLASHKRSNGKAVSSQGDRNNPKKNGVDYSLYEDADEGNSFAATDKVSSVTIKAMDAHIDGKGISPLTNYEFIPSYDENIRYYDDASSQINLEMKIKNDLSIVSGRIVSRDGITTNLSIVLEEGESDIDVPVLNKQSFAEFLINEKVNVPGGFLLIELNDDIEAVDISSIYEGRIFLDVNLKVTARDADTRYILYVGVKPGNSLIRYLSFNNNVAEKIIHIQEEELFFDKSYFIKSTFEKIEVRESRLLGKTEYDLNIDGDKINFFNTNIKSKNLSINTYKIKNPMLAVGMRKYYEFNHLDHTIFVGRWNKSYVEIPGSDYIDYIFDTFMLENLDGRCVVQVNLDDPAVEFFVAGQTNRGPMNVDIKYLDQDGLFNDEISPFAKKAFIIGEYEGFISYKIVYEDNSVDIIDSSCSPGSYLVEQL